MIERKRLRDLGFKVGVYEPGPWNAITDVADVRVGHVTLHHDTPDGRAVRTGVTAILPHGGHLFREKVSGACQVINGFGKTAGLVQVQELGTIESPIMLTNTLAVGAVLHGTIEHMLDITPEIGLTTGTVNVVVGECNDGYLNDIRGLHVTPAHAREAIRLAATGPVTEGAVGAGTGMSCLGYKGGVGTSSRQATMAGQTYTVGALVVSNFGDERDLAQALRGWGGPSLAEQKDAACRGGVEQMPDGSIMIVLATDAPLDAHQLARLARRAVFGLGRAGGYAAHGSGDIVIAFSTARKILHQPAALHVSGDVLHEGGEWTNALFAMTAEAVHEAILNSLCRAETMSGRDGHVRHAFPYDQLNVWLKETR